jgi:hypothetical protein
MVAKSNPFADVLDSLKRKFEPDKFALGDDGKPRFDKLGRFVNARAGRKEAAASSTVFIPGGERPPVSADQNAAGARLGIGLFQAALVMIGKEEGVLSEPEKEAIRVPLEEVLRKYNMGDKLTPELALAVVVGSVILARAGQPKTQTTFQRWGAWLRGHWVARGVRRVTADATEPPAGS